MTDSGPFSIIDISTGQSSVERLRLLTDGASQTVWASFRDLNNHPVGDAFEVEIPSATGATEFAELPALPERAVAMKLHRPVRPVFYEYLSDEDERLNDCLSTPAKMLYANAHPEWIGFGRWGA